MKTDKLLQLIQQKRVMRSGGALPLPKAQVGKPQPIVTLQRDQPVTRMIKDHIIGFANDPNVVKYNQTLKDPVWSDAYQFLMNWYSNPVTKERLRKQGAPLNPMVEALNQKRFDDAFDWYLDQREKNSKIAESLYPRHYDFNNYVRYKEDLNKIAENNYKRNIDETSGYHIPSDSSITITDSSRDKELNNQTAVHELTHATPLDDFYENYFKNFKPTKANQKELDYFQKKLYEIYPRIMDLRFQMNRDGILAPGMKVTPDMIEPYYNYSDDDIRNYYTLEELAKIMNEVAYNASAQESNQARQGGSLPIAQDGITVDEDLPIDPHTGKPVVFNLPEIEIIGKRNKPNYTNVRESTAVNIPKIKDPVIKNVYDSDLLDADYAVSVANKLLKDYNVKVDSTGNILKDVGLPSSAYYNPITRTINYNSNADNSEYAKRKYFKRVVAEIPHAIQADRMGAIPFLVNIGIDALNNPSISRYRQKGTLENEAHKIIQPQLEEKIDKAALNYPIARKQGGSLPKAQDGKPIYVTNPNDSRLKAYNDSLSLYNGSVKDLNKFYKTASLKPGPLLSIQQVKKIINNQNPSQTFFQGPSGRLNYGKYNYNSNSSGAVGSFSKQKTLNEYLRDKSPIKPIGWRPELNYGQKYNPNTLYDYTAEYQEPVQKVILQKEDEQKIERPVFDFSLNEDIQPIAPTPYVPDPVRRVMNPAFDFNVDFEPNRTKEAVVDQLGNPRYKYYNGDKVITEQEYNKLMQKKSGGSLDKYQWKYGQVSPRDSVQNIAYNTMTWEKNRGHESGYGLSDFGNPKLPTGATINDAVNWYMNNTYTNPIILEFPTAKEKGSAGDFIYNTGRDPRIYMLDQYLKSIGQTGLPGRGDFNIDMNQNPNDWAKKKPELDALWNKYKSQIYKLSENDRRILLNKGRDFYYQNINTNADGTPNDAYWNTWYGRQHATDQYVPFTDADVTNTSNKKFYPIKKQVGGSLPQAQFGGFPLGGLSSVLMSYLMNNTSNTPANNENPTNENLSDDIQRNAYYNWLKTQENNKNDIRGGWNSKLKLWMPYKSAEGGLPTIGYGHKLTPEDVKTKRFVKGITDEEAFDLMKNDFTSHYNLANKLYDKRFKNRNLTFNQLPYNQRLLIGDYAYNVGPQFFEEDTKKYPKAFPKFLNAIVDYNQAKSDKDRERYRNIIKKEYVRFFNKNTPMRERNKGTINLFLKDFGITPDMVDRSTYEKEEGGQLLPKHQLIGSVSSQLINQALGQNQTKVDANNIRNYAQEQKVAANTKKVAPRNDATIAPKGSVRSYVQKAADYMSHAGDPKVDEQGNVTYAGTPFDPLMKYVGAPILQSGINLANTIMGDRPLNFTSSGDIEGLAWDAVNLLPFTDVAASGAKKAITAFDDAGRMAFGATPQMGIFPKSFSDFFKKPKATTETFLQFKAPSLYQYDDATKVFSDIRNDLESLKARGANWDKIASDQGKTFNATNILHPEAIQYHGTYSGRPIVEVKMPDGTSEYFYKSTGWAKKPGVGLNGTTGGQWQVYGGKHLSGPGIPSSAWFLKGDGYKDYYGSKFFGDMANTMDDALLRKFNLNSVDELDNAMNFQYQNAYIDTFTPTPNKRDGGSLPKAQTGIPYDKIAQTAVKYSNPRKFIDIQPVYHQNVVIDNYSPKVNYLLQGDKLYMAPKGTDAWLDISDNNFAKKGVYNFLNETGQLKNYSQEERDIYNLLQNNQYDYFGRFNAKPAAPASAVVAPIAPADTTSVFGNTPWGTTGKVSNPVISKVIDPNNYGTTPLVKAAPTKTVVPVKKESMKDLILKELTSANDYAAKLYDDFTDALQDKVMGVASNIDSNIDAVKNSRLAKELRAIPGYIERGLMKDDIPIIGDISFSGDVTKTEAVKSKPTDLKFTTAATIDPKSSYPKRKNYEIEPLYQELATTSDNYLSYINVFDNNKGFDYIPTARLENAGKYSNVEGMAHFLFDYDMTTGQSADNSNTLFMHNNAKYINPKSIGSNEPLPSIPMRDLQEGKALVRKLLTYSDKELDPKSLKDVKADNPGSTVVDPYYTIWKSNPNGTVNVKYKKADEITKGDKLGDSLRQYRFTDINWDSQTQARSFKSSIGALRVKNSDVPSYFIYPKAKERGQKDAYGKFGGNSVIFLIEDTNVAIDFSGSINQIKDQGLRIIQQFGIKPEQLIVAYHDVGSYSAKPQDINGVIDSDRYYDFNTNKQTGAGLAIPKIRK